MRPQNLTKQKLSAMVPPAPDDRFDQELMGWFARHGGPWSGTASELLAALKTRAGVGNDRGPVSPCALLPHRVSHADTPFFRCGCLAVPGVSANAFAPVVPRRRTSRKTFVRYIWIQPQL